jgi:hypothetical protein
MDLHKLARQHAFGEEQQEDLPKRHFLLIPFKGLMSYSGFIVSFVNRLSCSAGEQQ